MLCKLVAGEGGRGHGGVLALGFTPYGINVAVGAGCEWPHVVCEGWVHPRAVAATQLVYVSHQLAMPACLRCSRARNSAGWWANPRRGSGLRSHLHQWGRLFAPGRSCCGP